VTVVILGLAVTATITVLARANYVHTEQRLTALQTSLTGQLLQTAPLQIESTLDRVAGLSAESSNSVATFDSAMAPLMKPKGQFISSSLVVVLPSGTHSEPKGCCRSSDLRTGGEIDHACNKPGRLPRGPTVGLSRLGPRTARNVRRGCRRANTS
jgi:hypothetical protein